MSDEFSQPLRGDKFDASEWEGALLLIFPTEYHSAIPTVNGDNAAVDCHIVGLDRGNATLRDARVWGRALIPQLKGAIGGKPVLGRLGRGQATKGNNPPWVLRDFSEADAQLARAYLAQHGDIRNNPDAFAQPEAPAQVPHQWPQGAVPAGPPTSNGYAGQATGGAVPPQYGAPAQAPAAPQAAPDGHDPNLVAQLVAKGVDLSKLPPGTDLKLLLAAL